MKNYLKKGKQVRIIAGKDKGKTGEIIYINKHDNKALVKGINMVKKHLKTTKERKGGIITKENLIHISNLTLNEAAKAKGSDLAKVKGKK